MSEAITERLKVLTEKARKLHMNLFLVYVYQNEAWCVSVIHPNSREEDLHGDTFEEIVEALEVFFEQYGGNVVLLRPKH